MRKQIGMINSFMPKHEKEWESRLFIDEAIKTSAEYHLEAIARAFCGPNDIRFEYLQEGFEKNGTVKADDGYHNLTEKFQWRARMREFIFYGKNAMDIWIQIIQFWAVSETIWPCGGAAYPNEARSLEEAAKNATNKSEQ